MFLCVKGEETPGGSTQSKGGHEAPEAGVVGAVFDYPV